MSYFDDTRLIIYSKVSVMIVVDRRSVSSSVDKQDYGTLGRANGRKEGG